MVDSDIQQINHYPAVLGKPTELSIGQRFIQWIVYLPFVKLVPVN